MSELDRQIEQVRSFNRFYTRQIGLLREGLLDTPYSLTQARVLYELGQLPGWRSSDLAVELGLDPGYLSRLLKRFEYEGLVERRGSGEDRRVSYLSLTPEGRREFEGLNARSAVESGEVLGRLDEEGRRALVEGMETIRGLLGSPVERDRGFIVRPHRPGDIGWVIARHGELYAAEYGWDISFEGFVAEIAGRFLTQFDPERERCWIAEREGERLGSVFLVRESETVAKLRMLLVEPAARGMGVGRRLVEECIAFARSKGYEKLTLWTNDILLAARRIYEREGFVLVKEERHHSFGQDLVGQFWELVL